MINLLIIVPFPFYLLFSKVFERLIHNRLLSFFTRSNTIVPTQYGFRHKHSTIHAILDLITMCYDNLDNNQPCTLLFLDIKKAFDSVSHKKLLKKLDFYGQRHGLAVPPADDRSYVTGSIRGWSRSQLTYLAGGC